MRIKFNVTAYEMEVLDRNDKRIYYVKGDNYECDLDLPRALEEIKRLVDDVNSVG